MFSNHQYYVTKTKEFHSDEQIITSMQHIAILHADSYCMQVLKSINMIEHFPILADVIFQTEQNQ